MDEILQTLEAELIAKQMASVYESLVAFEVAHKLGGRFELLADVSLENTWNLRGFGTEAKSLKLFL